METMSGQWLGFFFTAVLGVVAIAGPQLDSDSSRSLLLIAVLALVLNVLSAALYLAVTRLSQIHHYYDQIIYAIRDETISRPPAAVDLSLYRRPPATGKLTSTKGVSQLVLLLVPR
jgi:hypothetical protein